MENALIGKSNVLNSSHKKASEYANHNNLDDFFKFTIVRNPYTRAISEYFFREQEVTEFNDKHFYEWWCKFTLSKCDHLLPQSTYFEDINYDFVLKFESLKRGFNKMCKDLNIPIGLPHINKSNLNSKSCLPLLSEKSKKFLYDIYIDDFTNFGYKSLL